MNKRYEEMRFLIPKNVSWTVDDIFALEEEGKYREALEHWNVLLSPFQHPKYKGDPRVKRLKSHRFIWMRIGLCYRFLKIYNKAIDAYNKAIILANEARDLSILAEVHNNLGVVYRHLGDIKEAQRHNKKALRKARSIFDIELIVGIHDNIAHCYMDKGLLKKAFNEEQKAYGMLSASPSKVAVRTQGRVLGNFGSILFMLGNRQEGIRFMEKGLVKAREAGDHEQESLTLENLEKAR